MPREPRIENARITGTYLGTEDHGIFSCYVYLSGEWGVVGFGGYALDTYDTAAKRRIGTAYGLQFLMKILQTLEIPTWEALPQTYCRVEVEGLGGRALRIGHLLKDQWFDPNEMVPHA